MYGTRLEGRKQLILLPLSFRSKNQLPLPCFVILDTSPLTATLIRMGSVDRTLAMYLFSCETVIDFVCINVYTL